MKNKLQNKKWIIAYVGVALILAVGVIVYLSQGEVDEDSFPALSYEAGSTFKGYFADPGGYWQYETGDNCEHSTSLTETTLSSGLNYYYVTEDLTVQEIVDRIDCEPQNRMRILYKDPISQVFYSWPKKAHNETEELADPTSLTIKANTVFMIDSKDSTKMGEIYNVNTPLPPAPVMSPPVNPFNTGGPYEFVNDMTSGWVGIVGTTDGTQFSDDLNTSDIAGRVEKVFSKNGAGADDFQDVTITSGAVADVDFSDGEYMVWLKLGVELPEILIDLSTCRGDDPTHKCITDSNYPSTFIQTGEDACGTDACIGVEVSVHNVEGQDPTPSWGGSMSSCTETTFSSSRVFRAVCGEQTIDLSTCGGEDATHSCLTDGNNPAVFFQTGDEACAICTGIEASNHNIDGEAVGWISTGESCSDQGQDFEYKDIAYTKNWAFRAVCSSFQLAPIEVEGYMLPEADVNFCSATYEDDDSKCVESTGNDACSSIGRTCLFVGVRDENYPNNDHVNHFMGGGCDRPIGDYFDSLVSEIDWSIMAECSPCGFADSTHACVTSDQDILTNNAGYWSKQAYLKGDLACEAMGLSCNQLQVSTNHGTTWSDGLGVEVGSGSIECDDFVSDARGMAVINGAAHFSYIIRAECQ